MNLILIALLFEIRDERFISNACLVSWFVFTCAEVWLTRRKASK